jgi:hypothetical protein
MHCGLSQINNWWKSEGIGQLENVRDAQEHWGYGQGSNENQMNYVIII